MQDGLRNWMIPMHPQIFVSLLLEIWGDFQKFVGKDIARMDTKFWLQLAHSLIIPNSQKEAKTEQFHGKHMENNALKFVKSLIVVVRVIIVFWFCVRGQLNLVIFKVLPCTLDAFGLSQSQILHCFLEKFLWKWVQLFADGILKLPDCSEVLSPDILLQLWEKGIVTRGWIRAI